MNNGAIISPCDKHRYSLWRVWEENKPRVMFIGLNPSRADAVYNDPTITRCINFAKDWGFGSLYFANLYSFRTPYPDILNQNLPEAYNSLTNSWLSKMIAESEKVVCAWGSWNFTSSRAIEIINMINDKAYCFGLNKDGSPKHPLYLKSSSKTILWKQKN